MSVAFLMLSRKAELVFVFPSDENMRMFEKYILPKI